MKRSWRTLVLCGLVAVTTIGFHLLREPKMAPPSAPKPGVPSIIAHAKTLPFFLMTYEPDDSLGSYGACLEEVHRRGGGYCELSPESLHPGRHDSLYRKYNDASMIPSGTFLK